MNPSVAETIASTRGEKLAVLEYVPGDRPGRGKLRVEVLDPGSVGLKEGAKYWLPERDLDAGGYKMASAKKEYVKHNGAEIQSNLPASVQGAKVKRPRKPRCV